MTGQQTVVNDDLAAYERAMLDWRHSMEAKIRAEDGWLAYAGLYWLQRGANTIGSDPAATILLPESAPVRLGTLTLEGERLRLQADIPVIVDGEWAREADLRDELAPGGPTRVTLGSITFFIVRRKQRIGARVLDANSPLRQNFAGRHWFALDPALRLPGRFAPFETPQLVDVDTSMGVPNTLALVGRAEFRFEGQTHTLQAFDGGPGQLWFVFKDGTSGRETYGGGRFLYAPLGENGDITLDFNEAHLPACAFTPFATCPLPPPGNVLPFRVEAGERFAPAGAK